jgi:hypothetical protein
LKIDDPRISSRFFSDKEALLHTASFLLTISTGSTKINHYNQSKCKVDTKINQKKTRRVEKLCIGYSIKMPPLSSLEKAVLSNH